MPSRRATGLIASLLLLAAAGGALADDLPFFDNPYLKGGGTPSGAGAYGVGARPETSAPRRSAGPQTSPHGVGQDDKVERLFPGTGRYEGGTNTPCIGTTGFGSSQVIPGRKC